MSPNENKLIADQNAGAAARSDLLAVGDAFDEVKGNLFAAWMRTAPRDDTGREKLWVATTLLTQVEKVLRNRVSNGQVAEVELEAIRKAGDPKKIFGITF